MRAVSEGKWSEGSFWTIKCSMYPWMKKFDGMIDGLFGGTFDGMLDGLFGGTFDRTFGGTLDSTLVGTLW